MVTGKVKSVMGFQKSSTSKKSTSAVLPTPTTSAKQQQQQTQNHVSSSSGTAVRTLGSYLPRHSSSQVQPRPPNVSELLRVIELLRERESYLKAQLLGQKLQNESAAIVPVLEHKISKKDAEIERLRKITECLEAENGNLRQENEALHIELCNQNRKYEVKIQHMQSELLHIKKSIELDETSSSSSSSSSSCSSSLSSVTTKVVDVSKNHNNNSSSNKCSSSFTFKKCLSASSISIPHHENKKDESCGVVETSSTSHMNIIPSESSDSAIRLRCPRVPKPPPRPSFSSISAPSYGSLSDSADRALAEISNIPPPPPAKLSAPPPPPPPPRKAATVPAPPPPPPPIKGLKAGETKVTRNPEVVEFYHSLMRRDSICRRDSGGGDSSAGGATAKDMIGEIENRSSYLMAIKSDVETQGDFIRFLIKEVEGAAFTDIEDVLPFVKWLDDELSYLVDERAVLKHFDWPEKKADALREAAFGYSDLKKIESEASSFRDDHRQPCGLALKKMQYMFEKLEHSVFNLSRMGESATKRYKMFQIPVNWMLDTGYVSQIKLASVKLAMKYMKRVLAELGAIGGGSEEEDLILQGVKFAFRVHQFAGGFDVETMRAFQELRDKAQSCSVQSQNQNQHKYVCRSSAAC